MNILLPGINFGISCKKYLLFLYHVFKFHLDEQITQGKSWNKTTSLLTFATSKAYNGVLSLLVP